MSDPLILAIPSKGRLKDQVEAWLQDCGLGLAMSGGDRGYRARLGGGEGVQVRLVSAGSVPSASAGPTSWSLPHAAGSTCPSCPTWRTWPMSDLSAPAAG